jgi:hypothetical protein
MPIDLALGTQEFQDVDGAYVAVVKYVEDFLA